MDKNIVAGIIMGSDSDLPVMQGAAQILERFSIPYELTVVSAHRTPQRMVEYAQQAHQRGLKVIIAGAGGAAHLPGMIASFSPLPVIGVPIKTQTLNGIDSLYSIVQMPNGVPVATVAINAAKNAGLLAVQILSTAYPELLSAMIEYKTEMQHQVEKIAHTVEKQGYEQYLHNKK